MLNLGSAKTIAICTGMILLQLMCGCNSARKSDRHQWSLAIQSYGFRKDTIAGAIDKTKFLGVKYFEACSLHSRQPGMPGGEQANEVREQVMKKLEQTGIKLVNASVDLNKSEAKVRETFERAKMMRIQTLVSEPAAKQIPLLDKLTVEYGINVAIHNHARRANKPDYVNWNPDQVMKMLEGCNKRMGTCPDIGHWARSGLDTVEALAKYEGRIICVHLKDVEKPVPESRDVPLGTGIANIKGCLAELTRQNYSGVISIEYEHNPTDNMDDVAQCVKYFHQVAREQGR